MLTGEYYCEYLAEMEEKALKAVKGSIRAIESGEEEACEKLMYGLILSGLAMQMAGNSRPASGAEHHMSHFWEMEVINGPLDALHGEKVSVGTMLVLEEYKRLAKAISEKRCKVTEYKNSDEELLQETFGKKGILEKIRKENEPELLLEVQLERLKECLPEIAEIIEKLPEPEEMKVLLEKAGCRRSLNDIGLSDKDKELSLRLSPYVRRRLTLMRVSKMLEI